MRTRTGTDAVEGFCRHCSTWKAVAPLGGSAEERNVVGDVNWYWSNATGSYRSRCRTCESVYQRNRRNGTTTTSTRGHATTRRATGRGFGIEMEMTGPSASIVIDALVNAGIQMDSRNIANRRELPYSATNTRDHVWTLKHDGSVRGYGLELVSPILRGQSGLDEVATVCAALNSVGATVDRSTGLHVHHDFRRLDASQIRRQSLAFVTRENLIAELVAPSRRGNHYCSSWTERNIDALRAATTTSQLAYVGPRGTLNLSAYSRHGSVEIRFHGGSTNARKIVAWIRFGQAIFAAGEAEADVSTTSVEQMLFDLRPFGLTDADIATLLRFRRFGTTEAQVRASANEVNELIAELV